MNAELDDIVARASNLWERISGAQAHPDAPAGALPAEAVIAAWTTHAAGGDEAAFKRRLEWSGWDLELVRGAIATPVPAADAPWRPTLEAIVAAARLWSRKDPTDPVIQPKHPVPFEEILLPAVAVARTRLDLGNDPRFSPRAVADLERSLLLRLSRFSHQLLLHEFKGSRPAGQARLAHLLPSLQPSRGHYTAFVARHLQGGLLELFGTYPAWARLVARTTELWVESTTEFRDRLSADWEVLGLPDQPVASIRAGASDLHNGHRVVHVLEWPDGHKRVYKPKALSIDAAFVELASWLNDRGLAPPLEAPQVWNRERHGWTSFVDWHPCHDEPSLDRFYEGAGMLLCLLRVLGATDVHHENLVAHGQRPVVIDLETVMQPAFESDHPEGPWADVAHEVRGFLTSVARTGLLPRWSTGPDGRSFEDASGLGCSDPPAPVRRLVLKHVNTDAMSHAFEDVPTPPRHNVPAAHPVRAVDHVDAIERSFGATHRFLTRHRQELLSADGPLERLRNVPLRFVFRNSATYGAILDRSLSPEALRDGAMRSVALDQLSRAFTQAEARPPAWPLLDAEVGAMEEGDIPFFTTPSDGTAVNGRGLVPPHSLLAPALDAVVARLEALDDTDLDQQLAIIRGTFHGQAATKAVASREETTASPALHGDGALTPETMVAEAGRLARILAQHAIRSPSGHVYWMGLQLHPTLRYRQFQPLGFNLYDGRCGVGLFLAAFYRASGNEAFRALALDTVAPIQRVLGAKPGSGYAGLRRAMGIGGLTGVASVAYSLLHIGRLLSNDRIADDARALLMALASEPTEGERHLDVVGGSAGVILVLLRGYAETGEAALLDRARDFGHHLLRERVTATGGLRAWRVQGFPAPLAGFSHGAAGIAYALRRLHAAAGVEDFRAAALEAMEYEGTLFDGATSNWLDLREPGAAEGQEHMASWCHGAPGIGLSRFPGDPDREDAISGTLRLPRASVDHLCCGEFGRIEFLAAAGERTSALLRVRRVFDDALNQGGYTLLPGVHGVADPGFFQGWAGIGYSWLRLAGVDLPNVLLMD